MVLLIWFSERAFDFNALKRLQPCEASESLSAKTELVFDVGLVERIHVEVIQADTVIDDCETANGGRFVGKKVVVPLNLDNDPSGRRRPLNITNGLKRIHYSFENWKKRLPFG